MADQRSAALAGPRTAATTPLLRPPAPTFPVRYPLVSTTPTDDPCYPTGFSPMAIHPPARHELHLKRIIRGVLSVAGLEGTSIPPRESDDEISNVPSRRSPFEHACGPVEYHDMARPHPRSYSPAATAKVGPTCPTRDKTRGRVPTPPPAGIPHLWGPCIGSPGTAWPPYRRIHRDRRDIRDIPITARSRDPIHHTGHQRRTPPRHPVH
ncbi:hypothetical protein CAUPRSCDRAFT_11324 [Caulochytrium protostelioides]|uniref:Uncharacterized protein n=1 Tax=Caulochytrium protostelioides TaxID=1555241 RepID=A0A4P9WUE5_9FUNG|nr:hypothetical protein CAUPRSCDRAFT_11324 [Caulochytrium protostelioides]